MSAPCRCGTAALLVAGYPALGITVAAIGVLSALMFLRVRSHGPIAAAPA